jgi:dihydroorotase
VKIVLHNFRIVDEHTDSRGTVVVEDGFIREVLPWDADFPGAIPNGKRPDYERLEGGLFIHGPGLLGSGGGHVPVLMPALADLHAHFRDPGFPENEAGFPAETGFLSETLESASLAAAAGGYGTVVCMANTKPPIDTPEKALALRERAAALGLIDLYPVLSLTKNMEGRELSGITVLNPAPLRPEASVPYCGPSWGSRRAADMASTRSRVPLGASSLLTPHSSLFIRMLSEDGKDVADDGLFLAAMKEARRLGVPVSCHCDAGGPEAAAAKAAGEPRQVWSRIEENNAVRRAIELGRQAGCHIHIAHVSTGESAELIRRAKASSAPPFTLTCEATPHHIACTAADARSLGDESRGRVNPPLREEADRLAIIEALRDGTIDAIATDHAPHRAGDKDAGAPGFTGLETAVSVCLSELVLGRAGSGGALDLRRLSSLMSAAPARILGLGGGGPAGRGLIAPGLRADLVIADIESAGTVNPARFQSRGKNSPFAGRELRGKILLTLHEGRIVYGGNVW